MSKYKDFIVGEYDLLLPEFITTEKECWNNINKAQNALNEIKKYQINCVKKLAQLRKEKVIVKHWQYNDVIVYDYHVAKDVNDISIDNVICDDIIDWGDGSDLNECEVLEDYSHE